MKVLTKPIIFLSLSDSEKTIKLGTKPSVNSITGWDGKDGVIESDEIPLSELFGEGEL
jgi:hypothetical protein